MVVASGLVMLIGCQTQIAAADAQSPPVAGPVTPHAAAPASRFVGSIGVNTHLNYLDTPYGDRQAVRQTLRSLGVRHIRDGLPVPPAPDFFATVRSLRADGVGTDLVIGTTLRKKGQALTPVGPSLSLVRKGGAASILDSIEGPNEWDHRGGATWAAQVRPYQHDLYTAVHADPAFAGVPVIGPSVARRDRRRLLGDLSASLDIGNNHTYMRGGPTNAEIGSERRLAGRVSRRKPVIATETGYTDALKSIKGKLPVSEAVASVYVPRLFAEFFAAGIQRTYLYELFDQHADPKLVDGESHFGLLYLDKQPKPAFTALQRLIAITADTQPVSTAPVNFDYSVSGPPRQHDLVLHKGDGSFVLLLWRDLNLKTDGFGTDAKPQALTVRLGAPARVDVQRPSLSGSKLRTLQGVSTVKGNIGADLIALTISPRAAGGSPVANAGDAFATTAKPALGRGPKPASPPPAKAHRPTWLVPVGAAVVLLLLGALVLALVTRRRARRL